MLNFDLLLVLEAERIKTLKVKFGLKMSNNSNNKQTLKSTTTPSSTSVVNKKPSIFNQQDDDDDDDDDDENGTESEKDADSGFKPNKGMYI